MINAAVAWGGAIWLCQPRMRGGWHCGKCGRGVLSGRVGESCRICGAEYVG